MSIDNIVFKFMLVVFIGEYMLSFGVEGKYESLEDKIFNKILFCMYILNI